VTPDESRSLNLLREAINSAGLMACVRYDAMATLSAFTDWYLWASYPGGAGLIEVPLSDAREMVLRAENKLLEMVDKALS